MDRLTPLEGDGSTPDLLARHAPPVEPDRWDELRHPDGSVRPLWQRFSTLLPASGRPAAEDLDLRITQVAHQLRHDGVTHNVFGGDGGSVRPWSLEVLPLLIEPDDWARLEVGVQQRAALLEAMLDDLYGERRLLERGLMPPALLLRHPGYLRPLHGIAPAGGQRLHIVAFDVGRGIDGQWWVFAQRTQGPSGLGYVLHNRLVVSRQFPDAFRELRVQHLASSYRRLTDALEQRAQAVAGGVSPRVVLLTPGAFNETYFEHAYLARYLGLPLVEGGDLTVRGDRLFLKTVEGLEPVHGVLRRLDDGWCDPLELRPESTLGVPGLLQAVRAGTVVLANALGSAFLESPALPSFLPGISRGLLDEDLLLPSVPSWWCGEAAALASLNGQVDGKALRHSFPTHPNLGHEREAGADDIAADPDAWTYQDRLPFSRAPIWSQGAITPRPAVVRVYAVADSAGRWHVLPGGMTRVAPGDLGSVSMQRGGSSLDTWVVTEGRVDLFSMLPKRLSVDDIARRRRPVASRTAENLFWLGRYTERCEQLVRLTRIILARLDDDEAADDAALLALTELAVRKGLAPVGVPTLVQAPHLFERAVLAALVDEHKSSSVAYNLQAMSHSAMALRERLAPDLVGLIRGLSETFGAALAMPTGQLPARRKVQTQLDVLVLQLAAVTGAQTDRMTRDHGWRMLATGRLVDRLIGVGRRFEVFLETEALHSAGAVDLLLELFDSAITYRARYQRHDDLLALIDLLVLDSTNPRSFAGVLRRLRTEIGKLPGDGDVTAALLASLPAEGAGVTLNDLRDASDEQIRAFMLDLSRQIGVAGARLSDQIGQRYFALAAREQAMHWV